MASYFKWEADNIASNVRKLFGSGPITGDPDTIVDLVFDWPKAWERLDAVRTEAVSRVVRAGASYEWELNRPRKSFRACSKAINTRFKDDAGQLPKDTQEDTDKKIAAILLAAYWFLMLGTTKSNLVRIIKELLGQSVAGAVEIDYGANVERPDGTPMQRLIRNDTHEGVTGDSLAEAIIARLGVEIGTSRARVIAVTETTTALNAGSDAARRKLAHYGIVKGKQWVCIFRNSRDTHKQADGQRVEWYGQFIVGEGHKCDAPGDPGLPAKERCNCQCFGVTVTLAEEEYRNFSRLTKTPESYMLPWKEFDPSEPRDASGRWVGFGGGAPASQGRPQSSTAKVEIKPEHQKEIESRLAQHFGKEATAQKFADWSGAPDGSKVTVQNSTSAKNAVNVRFEGEGYEGERTIFLEKKRITNAWLEIDPKMQKQGIATAIFQQQVSHAIQDGFKQINAVAVRGEESGAYFACAVQGYDGELSSKVKGQLPPKFDGATKVSDLMKSEDGRNFWRLKGETFRAEFDLTEGSLSRQVLEGYSRVKAGQSVKPEVKLESEGRREMGGMFDRISKPDGGFTYSPITRESPTSGYAVSPYPERSFAKPAADLTVDDMMDFVEKNADILGKEGHHIGGWHDPATGQAFLDVSIVSKDEAQAAQLAVKHDQIAYFDLAAGKSVTVNQNATSGGVAPASSVPAKTPIEHAKDLIALVEGNPDHPAVAELQSHLNVMDKADKKKLIAEMGFVEGHNEPFKIVKQATARLSENVYWNREARKAGFEYKDVKAHANEIARARNQVATRINEMIDQAGGSKILKEVREAASKGGDYASVPGFDQIARTAAGQYQDILGDNGYYTDTLAETEDAEHAQQKLWEVLVAGRRKQMTLGESMKEAINSMYERRRDIGQHENSEGTEHVPF